MIIDQASKQRRAIDIRRGIRAAADSALTRRAVIFPYARAFESRGPVPRTGAQPLTSKHP